MSAPLVSGPWRAAHVLALSSLAVTEPLLNVLGNNPTFFVAHGAGPSQVLLVCAVAVLVLPVVLVALELLVGWARPAWAWPLHLGVVGALATLVASALLDDLVATVVDDLPLVSGPLTLVGAIAAGVVFVRAYGRHPLLRSTLSALVVAPAVFVFFFAFASPAHDLIFPTTVAAADVTVGGERPPVFVLVFDEVPLASVLASDATTIDADRFPNLARLAGDGVWYPDATTVAGYTHEAVPAILTGDRVQDENLPPTASGHPDSLFTLLARDYDIAAYEQLTELCTPAICERAEGSEPDASLDVLLSDLAIVAGHMTLPATLEDWLPTIDDTWANFGQDPIALDQEADRLAEDRAEFVDALGDLDRVGDFRAAVDEIQAQPDPQLTFIHTVFPHVPWSYHPDGTAYPDPGNPGLVDNVWSDAAAADLGLQRHLLQAQFADRLLGEFLDRLDAEGLYDEALVVFTADHGGSFSPGTHRRLPEPASLPGIMPVPVIVKPPADVVVREHRDDRVAETIDLVPTIADLLDAELPWDVDGRSLFGPAPEPHERGIYARGETVSTTGDLDLEPIVDHIWDRFGVDGHLQLYGLGPGAELIGRRAASFATTAEDPEACWSPAEPVAGTAGWVGGHVVTDDDEPVDLAVSVAGRVAGTAQTYADEDQDHQVFVLADPTGWSDGADLWQVTDDGLSPLPTC